MNNKKLLNLGILSLFLVLTISTVSAATITSLSLVKPFEQLHNLLTNNKGFVYALTLIFYFMLFYGIYAAALKNVPVFKGDHGLNQQGKVVTMAISGLTILALFALTKGDITKLLKTMLDPFGVFGGLALAALFAGITYFGIRGADPNSHSFTYAAMAAGIGMVIAGLYITNKGDSMMAWGFLIFAISLIIALFSLRGTGANDTTPPNMPTLEDVVGRPQGAEPNPGAAGAVPNQVQNFRGRRT